MAKKITNISGLMIEDIYQLNLGTIDDDKLLKQVTSRLVSAMNKRIARLGKSEIGRLSPTYQRFERKGKYSVKGLDREQTIALANQLRESMKKRTSLKEWKAYRKETLNKIGIEFNTIDDEKHFWEMYRNFEQNIAPETANWKTGGGSPVVMQLIKNRVDWERLSNEQKNKLVNDIYEASQKLKQNMSKYGVESDFLNPHFVLSHVNFDEYNQEDESEYEDIDGYF